MSAISAKQVKELRDRTGAGMLACRDALAEADGDIEKAVEILRAKGEASAAKRSGEASEGAVQSYIHANNKIGALVEVDCQTDFVARNEKFVEFARDVALHVAAAPSVIAITDDEVPPEDREREIRIATEQAADRPENVRERIVQGKLDKWLDEVVLLRQKHVNEDKHGGKTIEELRLALSAETRENIVVRRFSRFAVGG
jgi:elongation factor Ts